ncbi:MAG: DUF4392 domain-containing protein [Spirochaetaceae bacterium]|jgi:hypothetical protein|nr:DUF4392 domain-containing protein [Spirochaetaceae bacterium]
MTQMELTRYSLGKTFDNLMNIDPRGYGVCAILYDGALELSGGDPLTMHAADRLLSVLKEGDRVCIITGFVLHPFNKQETDGPVGAAALARTLVRARGVKPVFIVPEEAGPAMERLSALMEFSAETLVFTKDAVKASQEADRIARGKSPAFCIAIEAAGANSRGVYHNALGIDVSALEAKSDVLFNRLQKEGVPTLAIGDLGNECGMGALGSHAARYIPYAAECSCGCGGGAAALSRADTVLTATVSNWGAWGIASAIAWLTRDLRALYSPELEERALGAANECGLIDMYGKAIPAVDGMDIEKNKAIITLMNGSVQSALELEGTCRVWFEKTIAGGFFTFLPRDRSGKKGGGGFETPAFPSAGTPAAAAFGI